MERPPDRVAFDTDPHAFSKARMAAKRRLSAVAGTFCSCLKPDVPIARWAKRLAPQVGGAIIVMNVGTSALPIDVSPTER
jgi:hypothetical protein